MISSTGIPPSYRRLFAIQGFPRLVASMMLARTAGQMVSLILVLFALQHYGSAEVAGAVTFLSILPGLLGSPIAGALLDRHGRTRLMVLDYVIAGCSLALIAALAVADSLPVPPLLAIVTVTSLTQPLSNTGVRTLFPLIVPPPLWERANAIDSNGYVVASIFGPALALAVTTSNLGWGMFFLALPVIVLQRFGGGAEFVGLLFALNGVAASIAVLTMGRVSTRGRERYWLALAMLGQAAAFAIVLVDPEPIVVAVAMLGLGIAAGPFDIVLFTLRQRRTDPAWLGRAFAVSMALNFVGFPVGSAVAGAVIPVSIELVLMVAVACELLAAIFALVSIPTEDAVA